MIRKILLIKVALLACTYSPKALSYCSENMRELYSAILSEYRNMNSESRDRLKNMQARCVEAIHEQEERYSEFLGNNLICRRSSGGVHISCSDGLVYKVDDSISNSNPFSYPLPWENLWIRDQSGSVNDQ